MSEEGQSKSGRPRKGQSGQLVLEYILLMLLAVSMASLMKSNLIGGAPGQACDEAPVLTGLICSLTFAIAADTPGE